MSDTPLVLKEVTSEGFVILTFNRAKVRNALNRALVEALHQELRSLSQNPPPVLMFMGSGSAFMAGADIEELSSRGVGEAFEQINARLFSAIEAFPSPTIALMHGFALGGGCELALACDLRIASDDLQLSQPEVGLGIMPAAGATYRLARHVGVGRAKEMIFTGRRVPAQEALAIGLVNRVVAANDLRDAGLALARQINNNGSLAVRLAKASINAATSTTPELMQLEASHQAVLFSSADKQERMQAFLSKRAGASR